MKNHRRIPPHSHLLRTRSQMTLITVAWIAQAIEFMVTATRGYTTADIDAAIERALDLYINDNATPGSAIPAGVQHARRLIRARRAENNVVDLAEYRRRIS